MEPDAELATVAALIADRNRARMLITLLSGRPQSGSALAESAGTESAKTRNLRWARMCYDHLAGVVGVAVTEALVARSAVSAADGNLVLGGEGAAVFGEFGIDVEGLRRQRRPLLRPCLDWTERRHHLAGGMGAAVAGELARRGWIRPREGSRIVSVTPAGTGGLRDWLGVDLEQLKAAAA